MAAFPVLKTGTFNRALEMILSVSTYLFVLAAINSCVPQTSGEPVVTFDVLYNAGIESYAQERWAECVDYMRKAIADHKTFQDNLIECRLMCESVSKNSDKYLSYEDLAMRDRLSELSFFEIALRRSDCIRRCKKEKLSGRPESVDQEIMAEFDKLKPYDYLQICAYQSGNYKTAAAASFTYLLANPDHETMQKNVQFYRTLANVNSGDFYNMELKPHQDLYMKGVDTYTEKKYAATIKHIEGALVEYYKEFSRCSALCEGTYDHESFPDFYNAVADHWISVLRCKHQCPIKLATINGALVDNFLVEHYNYLQFSYYQGNKILIDPMSVYHLLFCSLSLFNILADNGNDYQQLNKAIQYWRYFANCQVWIIGTKKFEKDLKTAAACTATYLLLKPNDETMKQNKAFYLTMEGLKEKDFLPRGEATKYVDEQKMEITMIQFVNAKYKFSDADEDKGAEPEKPLEDEGEVKTISIKKELPSSLLVELMVCSSAARRQMSTTSVISRKQL
ncbi:hypothetical protein LSH36_231g04018 [Paralvinella palmiformis]|uniref:Leprecan-like alpha-helical domain-containing protein n=1 Tax=Paralvinella palmiformis TaxID=53620 RepID=A0AAD9N547_9ANNE|nr:hypothetical protein LSH36_231g04018 [Paralvinella palmiformis]